MNPVYISVQEDDFELQREYQALQHDCPSIGAIVTFIGLMRDFNEGDNVRSLFLEHYGGMTEKTLENICEQARERWKLKQIRIIHRIGELCPSDQIVFVGVSSAHRGDAFSACEFIMDFLKTKAPFWKREITHSGSSRWVEARTTDSDAAKRWEK